jgi:cytochrome P450
MRTLTPQPAFTPFAWTTADELHAGYRALRSGAPVYWEEALGSWLISGHEACRTVLEDTAHFSADPRSVELELPGPVDSIQTVDGPEHAALRDMLADAFRTQNLDVLVENAVTATRQRVAGRADFDAMGDFFEPLALRLISNFLGVPEPEHEQFDQWSKAIVRGMDAGLRPELAQPAIDAREAMSRMCDVWLTNARPGGVVAHAAGSFEAAGVPRARLANSLRVILHSGYSSTARYLGNALVALLTNTDVRRALREPRVSTHRAFRELVRHSGPVQALIRICTDATTVGGELIARGQPVTLLIAAANRDPAVFTDPDRLQLDREPNPELGFGVGPHRCMGRSLVTVTWGAGLRYIAADESLRLRAAPQLEMTATLRGFEYIPVTSI